MKNIGGNIWELENDDQLVDHWDPEIKIKAPEIIRVEELPVGGDIYLRFQGATRIVAVNAKTPEEAVSQGTERK